MVIRLEKRYTWNKFVNSVRLAFRLTVAKCHVERTLLNPHEKINQCLTNISRVLTNIFKI